MRIATRQATMVTRTPNSTKIAVTSRAEYTTNFPRAMALVAMKESAVAVLSRAPPQQALAPGAEELEKCWEEEALENEDAGAETKRLFLHKTYALGGWRGRSRVRFELPACTNGHH